MIISKKKFCATCRLMKHKQSAVKIDFKAEMSQIKVVVLDSSADKPIRTRGVFLRKKT